MCSLNFVNNDKNLEIIKDSFEISENTLVLDGSKKISDRPKLYFRPSEIRF